MMLWQEEKPTKSLSNMQQRLAKARARRMRRKRLRGRLVPAVAQEVSTRSRLPWPVTKAITRWHHYQFQDE